MLLYLARLNPPRVALWCYLIWYSSVLLLHFDGSPLLWLNSLGISLLVGTALYLSTAHSGATVLRLTRWQVLRFYLTPFCVSSFAALSKGHGFVFIFHPTLRGNAITLSIIAAFCATVFAAQRLAGGAGQLSPEH
jgi:hypothetical protein